MIPPPDPVIDAMAREAAAKAPLLTDAQKHRLAVLLTHFPTDEAVVGLLAAYSPTQFSKATGLRFGITEWLSPQQVADTTPFSLVKVKRDLRSGLLHGHQRCRGGKWSIHPSARDAWVQDRNGVAACGCERLRQVRTASRA